MRDERGAGPGRWATRGGTALGPIAAGLAVAAWAALFRGYGVFDLSDDGALLVQALRAARGERPYVDFHTGYGPLHFLVQGWLVARGGVEAVRWALVLCHGLGAALTYVAARRLVGSLGAAATLVVTTAFLLPVAAKQGAPFLVPYPAWLAGLCGLGCLVLLGERQAPAAPWRVALAGALAGAAAAMKLNSGLLFAGASVAAVVLAAPGGGGTGAGRRVGCALLVLLGAAAVVIVWPPATTVAWWALVPPVLALALLGPGRGSPDATVVPRVLVLAAGFAAVVGPAFAGALSALGPAGFAHEVLLIGGNVADVYRLPYPAAALLAPAAGALALAAWPRAAAGLGVVLLVGAGLGGAGGAPTVAAALRLAMEDALLVGVPLVAWGGVAALRAGAPPALAAPAALAVTAAVQLHPRPDFVHMLPVGLPLAPLAAWLVGRIGARLAPWGAPALAAAAVAVALVRAAPTLTTALAIARGRVVTVPVGDTRLSIDPAAEGRLRALATAAQAVAARSGPDDRVFAFPACALATFFARRLPAGRHDYFFPGRPTRAEAAAEAAAIAAAPVPVAVTCDAAGTDLAAAWTEYPEVVAMLRDRFTPVVEAPPFVVHTRRPAPSGTVR